MEVGLFSGGVVAVVECWRMGRTVEVVVVETEFGEKE